MPAVLPAFVLGWALMGTVSRLVRAAMLDELHADYVRTARAKGLAERRVMRHHVLRNALTAGDHDPRLLARRAAHAAPCSPRRSSRGTASAPTPCEATKRLDYPAINGVCLARRRRSSSSANLVTDLLYAAADPKIRYS